MSSIAEKIKRLREEHGWSRREFARRMESNGSQIQRIEEGRVDMHVSSLAKVAKVFDCELIIEFRRRGGWK